MVDIGPQAPQYNGSTVYLQIDFFEGICIACDTLFKDHMHTGQWSDTGPPGPLVLFSGVVASKTDK